VLQNDEMSSAERSRLAAIVSRIAPVDEVEEGHRLDTLAWIASDLDLHRYPKPDGPPKHLVAYFVLVDLHVNALLLVDHRNAQRWLPTGGHVEPGEDPSETVRRELREELGIAAEPVTGLSSNPLLITQTTTVGLDAGHVDVSLWYVLGAATSTPLNPDHNEFASARWWAFAEIDAAPRNVVDPHLPRFVAKLRRDLSEHQR
jgi:8-oxo-dGTP diphosphatase